ncbi:HAUS augmin-like complex subunit 8 isoform X2 [Rhinoraja longicauda]
MVSLKDELSGFGRLVRSSKSVPDLSESKCSPAIHKLSSPAVSCQRPTTTPTPRLSQCSSTQKSRALSQNVTVMNLKEESEGSDLASSMEELTKKSKGGRIVPSRFRAAAAMKKKVVNKILDKSSGPKLKRQNAEHLKLHSTVIEESKLMPSLNWELSVMKSEYSPVEVPECTTILESCLVPPPQSEDDAMEKIDFDELLFSEMDITRRNYLGKYQENAERNLLLLEEETQRLRREIFEYKHEYLMRENKKQLNLVIEQQMEFLKLALPSIWQFKIQYKILGQALDATRHSLQVRNIHMSDDPRENLENLKVHLKTTQQVLTGLGLGMDKEDSKALAEIKELGVTALNTDKEMKSFFGKIEETAYYISRETVLLHQELNEQVLGMDVSARGIFK